MAVRLIPVNDAPTMLRIDKMIDRPMNAAAVGNTFFLYASEDGIEIGLAHAKTVMDGRERLRPFVEIQRQAIVQIDGSEGPYAGFRPWHTQKFGQQLRRRHLVAGRNQQVVELDRHQVFLLEQLLYCKLHIS